MYKICSDMQKVQAVSLPQMLGPVTPVSLPPMFPTRSPNLAVKIKNCLK